MHTTGLDAYYGMVRAERWGDYLNLRKMILGANFTENLIQKGLTIPDQNITVPG